MTLAHFLLEIIHAAVWQDLETWTHGKVSSYASSCSDTEWASFMRDRLRLEQHLDAHHRFRTGSLARMAWS